MRGRAEQIGQDERSGVTEEMSAVAIIGVGASGVAAALLARTKGAKVYVSDTRNDASAAAGADRVRVVGADVELGRHDVERIAGADTVVVSPGIPPDAPVLRALGARGVRDRKSTRLNSSHT